MAKDGHIYKRGTIYWLKYYRAGKPLYESTKSNREVDARRLLRRRLGQITEGAFLGLHPEKVRIDELANDLLNDYRINRKKSLADVAGGFAACSLTSGACGLMMSPRIGFAPISSTGRKSGLKTAPQPRACGAEADVQSGSAADAAQSSAQALHPDA